MMSRRSILLFAGVVLLASFGSRTGHSSTTEPRHPLPKVFLLDAKEIDRTKQRILNGDSSLAPALAKLEADANKALKVGPFSVVTKNATPPSGDKHGPVSL